MCFFLYYLNEKLKIIHVLSFNRQEHHKPIKNKFNHNLKAYGNELKRL